MKGKKEIPDYCSLDDCHHFSVRWQLMLVKIATDRTTVPKLSKCSFFVVLNALRAAALCRNQREQEMEHPTNGDCTSWKLPTPALFERRTVRFEPVILAEAPKKRQRALQESNKDTFPTKAVKKRSHEPSERVEPQASGVLFLEPRLHGSSGL